MSPRDATTPATMGLGYRPWVPLEPSIGCHYAAAAREGRAASMPDKSRRCERSCSLLRVSAQPRLVGDEPPDRVELVVVDALGHQLCLLGTHRRNPVGVPDACGRCSFR